MLGLANDLNLLSALNGSQAGIFFDFGHGIVEPLLRFVELLLGLAFGQAPFLVLLFAELGGDLLNRGQGAKLRTSFSQVDVRRLARQHVHAVEHELDVVDAQILKLLTGLQSEQLVADDVGVRDEDGVDPFALLGIFAGDVRGDGVGFIGDRAVRVLLDFDAGTEHATGLGDLFPLEQSGFAAGPQERLELQFALFALPDFAGEERQNLLQAGRHRAGLMNRAGVAGLRADEDQFGTDLVAELRMQADAGKVEDDLAVVPNDLQHAHQRGEFAVFRFLFRRLIHAAEHSTRLGLGQAWSVLSAAVEVGERVIEDQRRFPLLNVRDEVLHLLRVQRRGADRHQHVVFLIVDGHVRRDLLDLVLLLQFRLDAPFGRLAEGRHIETARHLGIGGEHAHGQAFLARDGAN